MRIEGAAIAGVGMVRFGNHRDRTLASLARDAGLAALHDAGMTLADAFSMWVIGRPVRPSSFIALMPTSTLGWM